VIIPRAFDRSRKCRDPDASGLRPRGVRVVPFVVSLSNHPDVSAKYGICAPNLRFRTRFVNVDPKRSTNRHRDDPGEPSARSSIAQRPLRTARS